MSTITRKRTSIQLQSQLLGTLREKARENKISVSRLVEVLLFDSLFCDPNDETIAAINESRSGKYAGTVDLTDMKSFRESLGI